MQQHDEADEGQRAREYRRWLDFEFRIFISVEFQHACAIIAATASSSLSHGGWKFFYGVHLLLLASPYIVRLELPSFLL